jgi:hypothetical protein
MKSQGRNFMGFPLPSRPYDVAQLLVAETDAAGNLLKGFETRAKARAEDKRRSRVLLNSTAADARRLGTRLRNGAEKGRTASSLASKGCGVGNFVGEA